DGRRRRGCTIHRIALGRSRTPRTRLGERSGCARFAKNRVEEMRTQQATDAVAFYRGASIFTTQTWGDETLVKRGAPDQWRARRRNRRSVAFSSLRKKEPHLGTVSRWRDDIRRSAESAAQTIPPFRPRATL